MGNTKKFTSKYHGLYKTFSFYFYALPESLSQPNKKFPMKQ